PVREARPQRGRERAPPCDGGADAAGELSGGSAGRGCAQPLSPAAAGGDRSSTQAIHPQYLRRRSPRQEFAALRSDNPPLTAPHRYRGIPFPRPKAPSSTPDRSRSAERRVGNVEGVV